MMPHPDVELAQWVKFIEDRLDDEGRFNAMATETPETMDTLVAEGVVEEVDAPAWAVSNVGFYRITAKGRELRERWWPRKETIDAV